MRIQESGERLVDAWIKTETLFKLKFYYLRTLAPDCIMDRRKQKRPCRNPLCDFKLLAVNSERALPDFFSMEKRLSATAAIAMRIPSAVM